MADSDPDIRDIAIHRLYRLDARTASLLANDYLVRWAGRPLDRLDKSVLAKEKWLLKTAQGFREDSTGSKSNIVHSVSNRTPTTLSSPSPSVTPTIPMVQIQSSTVQSATMPEDPKLPVLPPSKLDVLSSRRLPIAAMALVIVAVAGAVVWRVRRRNG